MSALTIGAVLIESSDVGAGPDHPLAIFLASRSSNERWFVITNGIRRHALERLAAFAPTAEPLLARLPDVVKRRLGGHVFNRLLWERAIQPIVKRHGIRILVARLPAFVPEMGALRIVEPELESTLSALEAFVPDESVRTLLIRPPGALSPISASLECLLAQEPPRLLLLPEAAHAVELDTLCNKAGVAGLTFSSLVGIPDLETDLLFSSGPVTPPPASWHGLVIPALPASTRALHNQLLATMLGRRVDLLLSTSGEPIVIENARQPGLVSVCIVNWNGRAYLPRCLEALDRQDYPGGIEVIVVDNASSDGSLEFLRASRPDIKLLINGRNTGFSAAQNQAIDASRGEFVLPLNFDVFPEPGFIREMVGIMQSDPRIGIVSGKLFKLIDGKTGHLLDSTGITMRHLFMAARGEMEEDKGQYDGETEIFGACGAAPLYRREMLDDIRVENEYFDEDFVNYVEDVDLSWRARLRGWRCVFTPKAVASHERGATRKESAAIRRDYLVTGLGNRYATIIKNLTAGYWRRHRIKIIGRELLFLLKRNPGLPWSVRWRSFRRGIAAFSRMLAKRRIIQPRNRIADESMEPFFRYGEIDLKLLAEEARAEWRARFARRAEDGARTEGIRAALGRLARRAPPPPPLPRKPSLLWGDDRIDPVTVFQQIRDPHRESGAWFGVSVSDDPQIILFDDAESPLCAAELPFLHFSLFSDRNSRGQLIWWLADGRWQTSRSFAVQEGWVRYCIDMRSLPTTGATLGSEIGWEGDVTRLRLDPGELPEVRIGIRDIAALREPRHEPTGVDLIQRPPPAQEEAANILLNYEECRTLPAAMKSIPTLIYAEISTVCNLKCRMCGRAHYDIPASHQGLMSIETFRALSPLFTPGAMLGLFGRGESLMHPRFIEFLEIATRAGMKVGFNTNGLMLTTETARAMCELGQCHITFSVSAGTRETYRVIHGEDSWDRLWEKIGLLNEIKRQTGKARGLNELGMIKPVVYLEFVAQADNIRELPDLLRRAYDHEVSGLLVIDLTAHSEALESMRMNIPENQELARAVYQETLALHEELALRTNNKLELRLPHSYSNLAKKFITESESRILEEMRRAGEETSGEVDLCLEPWRTFYARFDGTVAPCVITGRILGDLKTTGALEIWNGEGFRRFRERMKTSSKPSECQRCHLCPGPKRYDVTLGDATTYEAL